MVCAKLENADQHIVDLKQQLDNALGAEEMLEQLTERTLYMGEVSIEGPGPSMSAFLANIAVPS